MATQWLLETTSEYPSSLKDSTASEKSGKSARKRPLTKGAFATLWIGTSSPDVARGQGRGAPDPT